MAIDHPYVNEVPGVGGGYPQVRGTRIPVRCIILTYRYYGDIERTIERYSTLTPEQVRGALAFYAEHPEPVDEDIERHERAYAEHLAQVGQWHVQRLRAMLRPDHAPTL